jgi:hypothetical protein
MPVVVKAFTHDRHHGCRTGPEIVVNMVGYRLWFAHLPNRLACVEYRAVHPFGLAILAREDVGAGLVDGRAGAVLRAGLDDPIVPPRGLDHLAPFPDAVAHRFLDINMFTRLAGHDRHQRVPVIGSRDHHGVDRRIIQDATKVLMLRDGTGQMFCRFTHPLCVRVTNGGDFHGTLKWTPKTGPPNKV